MSFVKIVVTAPVDHADAVRSALASAGAGALGNYTECSFSSVGHGRFRPNDDANPFIGNAGELVIAEEERIEVLCERSAAKAAVEAARAAHPYEEPAFDVYALVSLDEL